MKCEHCHEGVVQIPGGLDGYATKDMAMDGEDPSLEGSPLYHDDEYDCCPCCHGNWENCEVCKLEIKLKEDKGLREKSVEVKEVNEEIINLCREMATLMNESGGAGLAAPQIGQNIRLFVVVNGLEQYYAFINPEIISQSDEFIVSQEGCLSYPGEEFCVLRRKKVMVKHLDTEGKFKVAEADDFLSCVLQHEIDHLNGILIEDRDDPMLRDQIKPVNTKPPKRKKRKKKK